jgi:molybdopterin synthase catalytic subunit
MDSLIQKVKSHPDSSKAGMILCHNGIVRASDRSGSKKVRALHVNVDAAKIAEVVSWAKSLPGIVEVLVEALDGELTVGDDLLFVVVAGDLRENVFDAMRKIIDRIKLEGVSKKEIYDE